MLVAALGVGSIFQPTLQVFSGRRLRKRASGPELVMHGTLTPLGLLGVTVVALVNTRARGLPIKVMVETVLLFVIGIYLLWQGTSPLPHLAGLPVDFAGAWVRALAIIWWLVGARLAVNIAVLARGRDPKSRQARLSPI